MWGMIFSILASVQPISVCEVHGGVVPIGTRVELEGRALSDMHSLSIGDADGDCAVALRLSDAAYGGTAARSFLDATRDAALGRYMRPANFRVALRGRVEWEEPTLRGGGYLIVVDEVTSFAIDGVPQ